MDSKGYIWLRVGPTTVPSNNNDISSSLPSWSPWMAVPMLRTWYILLISQELYEIYPFHRLKKKQTTKAYTCRCFGQDHEWCQEIRARLLNTNPGWSPSAAWTLTNSSPATSSNHTLTHFPGILHHWPYLLFNTWRHVSHQIRPCSTSHYETDPLSAGLSSHPERVSLVFLPVPTSLLLLPALSDFPAQVILSLLDPKL